MEYTKIKNEIIKLKNDIGFQKLESFYATRSLWEVLGVHRKENSHSGFLAWLLDNKESHGLGDFSLRKLFDIILKWDKGKKIEEELTNILTVENYEINSARIKTERFLENVIIEVDSKKKKERGRIDIFIELKITTKTGEEKLIRLVIENKVESTELNAQTIKYYNHFSNPDNQESDFFAGETVDETIYIYLTPISNKELGGLSDPECESEHFIQINYQSLVDYLIEPALNQNISVNTKNILEEYLKTLSQPSLIEPQENSSKNQNSFIMAIGNKERKLLTEFWDQYKDVILASVEALAEDSEQDPETTDDAKEILEATKRITSRRNERYLYTGYNGKPLAKGRTVLAIVKSWIEKNNTQNLEYWQNYFATDKQSNPLVPLTEAEDINNKIHKDGKTHTRYFTQPDDIIILNNGQEIALTNQWGAGKSNDTWTPFVEFSKDKLGIEIIEAR